MDKSSLFTEKEAQKMDMLPAAELQVFMNRFARISIEQRIADDKLSETYARLSDETDQLVKDIKERLECMEET